MFELHVDKPQVDQYPAHHVDKIAVVSHSLESCRPSEDKINMFRGGVAD